MRIHRLGTALAATALLFTAACGGDAEPSAGEPAGDLSSAAAPSEEPSPSPTDEPSPSPSADEAGGDVDPAKFGRSLVDAQLEAGTAHIDAALGQGTTMKGDMAFSGKVGSMDVRMTAPGMGKVHMIVVDGFAYMQIPGAGAGNKFVKVNLNDPNNPLGGSFDISKSFQVFEDSVTSVRELGADDIRGTEVTKYVVTVDTVSALEAQGMDPSKLGGTLPPELDYTIWLDDASRMHRMAMDIPGQKITMNMSRWGEPVQIKAPPAARVMEMPKTPS